MGFEIVKKTDAVSYDRIAEVLHDAHKSNWDAGMHFETAVQSGEELREHLGDDGDFYLIMDREEIAAVGAIKYRTWKKWFCKGELCGDIMLIGVRQAYKGKGLSKMLYTFLEQKAFERCKIVTMNTAVTNTIMLNSRLHDGWAYVDYFSHEGTNFYSIMLAKWREECPYSEGKIRMMYRYRRALVRCLKDRDGHYRPLFKALLRK